MKKGYYIHFEGRQSIGVSKKIDAQLEEFNKYYDMQEAEVAVPHRSLFKRIIALFPTASIERDYDKVFKQLDNPAFLYVRRTVADRAYLNFWRKVKQAYPDCKIIVEIFTYPYDKDDFGKWNAWPFLLKEYIYRPKLKKYVDRFVTYTDDKEIFGVPTICTINGINVDKIAVVQGEYNTDVITLLGVAFMQRHHGYERIIEGLNDYYQRKNQKYVIRLLLVGNGPEKERYLELVKKYHLEKYVEFHATISGKELDEIYDESDIALASFGMYKLGFYGKLGALKTREYLSKGMPVITGCAIDVIKDDYPYAKLFSNDNKVVDMAEVIEFYEKIKKGKSKQAVAESIRNYAYNNVSIESAMRPIIDYIEE